jgi:hypothetical protein
MKIKLLLTFILFALLTSCATVKPYEQIFINDSEMQMGGDETRNFDNYVHSIREGSMPAGSVKSSGGCGCN